MDVACTNRYIVYNMLHPGVLSLLNFKIVVATNLIGAYTSRKRGYPENKTGSKRKQRYTNAPSRSQEAMHLLNNGGADHKTYVECSACGVT